MEAVGSLLEVAGADAGADKSCTNSEKNVQISWMEKEMK